MKKNSVPILVNTVFAVIGDNMKMQDLLISDFTNNNFTSAFKQYFAELGINVSDWNSLWEEMNSDKDNLAYVKVDNSGRTIGFIQFKAIELSNNFFAEKYGFIREFWISKEYRGKGFGMQLLNSCELYFEKEDISQIILTTDTAEEFYIANGYSVNQNIVAKNDLIVMTKAI